LALESEVILFKDVFEQIHDLVGGQLVVVPKGLGSGGLGGFPYGDIDAQVLDI
jgi:hypothetical protein